MSRRLKNHTLKGNTSPYSLSIGVPPPPRGKLQLTQYDRVNIRSLILIENTGKMRLKESGRNGVRIPDYKRNVMSSACLFESALNLTLG